MNTTCAYSYCLREAASWALLAVMLSGTAMVTTEDVSASKLMSMVSAHAVSAFRLMARVPVLSAAEGSVRVSLFGAAGESSLQAAKAVSARVRRKVNPNDLPPPYNIS